MQVKSKSNWSVRRSDLREGMEGRLRYSQGFTTPHQTGSAVVGRLLGGSLREKNTHVNEIAERDKGDP